MRRIIVNLFILCCALALSSCGFHSRGAETLSPTLQNVYIKTNAPYDQLARNLRDYLKKSGVFVVSSPEPDTTTIEILRESESQQLLGVSGTQQTRQYNLILTVNYQVLNGKGVLIVAPQTATETRSFTTTSNQILGGTNESDAMYQQMRLSIVADMMFRLSSHEITYALNKAQP